jgi:hypothetical protein
MANDAIATGLRADLTRAFDSLQMGPPLGAPMQPNDAGRLDMPLFEVVYWIVTKGGSIGFDHSIRAQWNEAWAELLGAWRQNQVTITGRPLNGGFPEKIVGEAIAGVRILHPFGVEEPPSSTGCPYIRSSGRAADDESWENGCNEQLYRPGEILGWTHLQALRTDVGRRWPFPVAKIDQAPAPDTAKETQSTADNSDALLALLPDMREPTAKLIWLSEQEPRTPKRAAAWKAMNFLWSGGIPSDLETSEILVKVNAWINKQPRSNFEFKRVGREAVERLLGRRK